jgi:hypothetical protein
MKFFLPVPVLDSLWIRILGLNLVYSLKKVLKDPVLILIHSCYDDLLLDFLGSLEDNTNHDQNLAEKIQGYSFDLCKFVFKVYLEFDF